MRSMGSYYKKRIGKQKDGEREWGRENEQEKYNEKGDRGFKDQRGERRGRRRRVLDYRAGAGQRGHAMLS